MSIIALYAGGPLGPTAIQNNLSATQQAGWTTIILGLFHIGRPDIPGQSYGDIIFGGDPIVIQKGKYLLPDQSWPNAIAQLKNSPTITQIYASFGGGGPVFDYTSIRTIYEQNGNTFAGTALEQNFRVFREYFPAIDGIDLDCEDVYDPPSFNAFCEMLAGMGFALTFCPYTFEGFWAGALGKVQTEARAPVRWWNLQCYDGGGGNDPQDWAGQIPTYVKDFPTDGFIVAGAWTEAGGAAGVQSLIASFASEAALGGAFIWNMDGILNSGATMASYVTAIRNGLAGQPGDVSGAAAEPLAEAPNPA